MSGELLRIEALSVRFGDARVVDGVSLAIAPGETLAVVGESGSGKSLTAMAVLGLTPPAARVEGTLLWHGRALGAARLRGRGIGIVFQEPAGCLNPLMTVGAQIAEAAGRNRPVATLLEEVGLTPPHATRFPHELSGGQQQRVMIAIALAGDPALLVADEPTTALDATVQAQIITLLRALKARRGMALLFISHDLGLVAGLADRVAVMHAGRIVEEGATAELFANPRHRATQALLAARLAAARPPCAKLGATVLTVQDLAVTYPRRGLLGQPMRAVDGVSFSLAAGETLGLVGESGSGKSTVARAIIGLVPAAGRITLFGEALKPSRAPGHPRCRMVFQDSGGSLNPRLRVAAIIGEPLDLAGRHRGAARMPALARLLAEVRLPPAVLHRYPHELSGGQRQRVNIARALALDPDLLICDEIVSALDVTVQAQVLNLLQDIQAARGLALLFISHDLAVIRFMADRVAVMKDGTIVETGSGEAVLARPTHAYTQALAAAHAAVPA